jgi:hypothetical protein
MRLRQRSNFLAEYTQKISIPSRSLKLIDKTMTERAQHVLYKKPEEPS